MCIMVNSCCETSDNAPCYECLEDAIKRVRELHKSEVRNTSIGESTYCYSCTKTATKECSEYIHLVPYPCPTIKALDGKQ